MMNMDLLYLHFTSFRGYRQFECGKNDNRIMDQQTEVGKSTNKINIDGRRGNGPNINRSKA